jgi:hypothetical protein
VNGPKLDNSNGGFPPFDFGKGGDGGDYFGRFFHFPCVLLVDYLKEAVPWFRRSSKHWAGAITVLISVTVT